MPDLNTIQIANSTLNLMLKASKEHLGDIEFSSLFKKFLNTKLKNSSSFIKINLNFSSANKLSKSFLKTLPLLETSSWNIYETRSCLYFVLFRNSRKQKINQILELKKKKFTATLYFDENKEKIKHVFYPLDQFLFQWSFIKSNAFMMHGCAFMIANKGFIALGESETGKTTLLKTLKKNSSELTVLNDERNVIWKNQNNKYFISPTPWHGELTEVNNLSTSLDYIFFIEKNKETFIKPVTLFDAYVKSIKTCFMPFWDKAQMTSYTVELEKMLLENKNKLFSISYDKESNLCSTIKDFTTNA